MHVALALRLYESDWLYLWMDLAGLAVAIWAAGAVAVLSRRGSPSWALAMSATGLLLLAVRLPMLPNFPEGVPWRWAPRSARCSPPWPAR